MQILLQRAENSIFVALEYTRTVFLFSCLILLFESSCLTHFESGSSRSSRSSTDVVVAVVVVVVGGGGGGSSSRYSCVAMHSVNWVLPCVVEKQIPSLLHLLWSQTHLSCCRLALETTRVESPHCRKQMPQSAAWLMSHMGPSMNDTQGFRDQSCDLCLGWAWLAVPACQSPPHYNVCTHVCRTALSMLY